MKNISLRQLIIITLLIITIVPTSALGILSYGKAREILIEELQDSNIETMENAKEFFINNYIDENEELIKELALDFKQGKHFNNLEFRDEMLKKWEIIQNYNENIIFIYLGIEDDEIYVAPEWKPPIGYSVNNRPWYLSAINSKGRVAWSEPYQEYATSEMVVSTSMALEHEGKFYGVLSIDTSLKKLSEIIINMEFGVDSYALLLDKNGNVIGHSDQNLIGQNLASEQWFETITKSENSSSLYDINGQDMFISHVLIPNTQWRLVSFVPRQSLDKEIGPIKNWTISVAIISILAAIILSILISGWITKKINTLIQYMEDIEGGNFKVRWDVNFCKEMITLSEKFNNMVVNINDLIRRKDQAEKQLRYLSIKDTLTGAYNRNYFEEKINELSKKEKGTFGIIICDVDGLKLINDSFGHSKGDAVLIETARIINKCIPENGTLFRIGGDEFIVLASDLLEGDLSKICKDIRDEVNNFNITHKEYLLSVSLGYEQSNTSHEDIHEVFKNADSKMYQEKLLRGKDVRRHIGQTLIEELETKDFLAEGHGERLKNILKRFGKKLKLSEEKIKDLELLAKFHDVGNVGISNSILFKKGTLTDDERREVQKHSDIGYRIAKSSHDFRHIAGLILKHHEWWNGEGYPLQLKGEEIPLECRMLAIVDAYDTMTNDRPYRRAISHDDAIEELLRCSGTMFDPELVNIFIKLI